MPKHEAPQLLVCRHPRPHCIVPEATAFQLASLGVIGPRICQDPEIPSCLRLGSFPHPAMLSNPSPFSLQPLFKEPLRR